MQLHHILTDRQFEVQFENCILNPKFFTHEAHLRLAWIHITQYGEQQAIVNMSRQIPRFDKTFGTGRKYNATVTVASVKAVSHFIKKSQAATFQDFVMKFPQLRTNFKALLQHHYSLDIFNDEHAREDYLEPDLIAF